jgi:hypothetical protein
VHIKTDSFLKNGPRWAYSSTVPAANTPLTPDHCGFGLNHIQDKTRTNRNASFAANTIFRGHRRRADLAFHHSSILPLSQMIREQNGECPIELFESCNV